MELPTLSEMCKAVREALAISQKKMAELVGTNQTEISFIERGFVPEDKAKIEKIKDYYERWC